MRHTFLPFSIFLFGGLSTFAADASATTNAAAPKIERIALFKNGLGYASSVGTIPDNATSIRIGQLPVPSYGTFWVGYSKDLKVRHLTTAMETMDEPAAAAGVDELLRLNPGRKVVLHMASGASGEQSTITGTVQSAAIPPILERQHPTTEFNKHPLAERDSVRLSLRLITTIESKGS